MKKYIWLTLLLSLRISVYSQEKQDTAISAKDKLVQQAPNSLRSLLNDIKESEMEKTTSKSDIEIDGLLLSETKTKNGRDFFDVFYKNWLPPQNARNYSILISEKPYRLTTTLIEIKINERLVYKSFLQPRSNIIEALALQAIEQTKSYLKNYEELEKQLLGEDQVGTGIF